MIKLTDIINELGINKPTNVDNLIPNKFYKVEFIEEKGWKVNQILQFKGYEYYANGMWNQIRFKIIDKSVYMTFTVNKTDIAKIESVKKPINELGINKTSLFDRLKEDGDYLISWDDNGITQTEKIKVLGFDSDGNEEWANVVMLSNIKKWRTILDLKGTENPWIQLFPEQLISLKPLND